AAGTAATAARGATSASAPADAAAVERRFGSDRQDLVGPDVAHRAHRENRTERRRPRHPAGCAAEGHRIASVPDLQGRGWIEADTRITRMRKLGNWVIWESGN